MSGFYVPPYRYRRFRLGLEALGGFFWGRSMTNRTPPSFPMSGATYLTWLGTVADQSVLAALLQDSGLDHHRFRLEVTNGLLVGNSHPYQALVTINGLEHQMIGPTPQSGRRVVWTYDTPDICTAREYVYWFRLNPASITAGSTNPYGALAGQVGWIVPQQGSFHIYGAADVRLFIGAPALEFVIVNQRERVAVVTVRIQPVQPNFEIIGLPATFPAQPVFLDCGETFRFRVRYTGTVSGAQAQLEMKAVTSPVSGPSSTAMASIANLTAFAPPV